MVFHKKNIRAHIIVTEELHSSFSFLLYSMSAVSLCTVKGIDAGHPQPGRANFISSQKKKFFF